MKVLSLLPHFIARDIRERYVESAMGLAWAVLQPLAMVLLYWFVFSVILQFKVNAGAAGEIPFAAYLLSGIVPWFIFQAAVTAGASSIVGNRDIITKVAIPAEVFPLSSVVSTALPFAVIYLFLAVFLQSWIGEFSIARLALVVLILFFQFLFMCGFVLILSALSAYLRDILQFLEVGLPVLLFTSPVLYSMSIIPERYINWMYLNPYTPFVISYHQLTLYGELPGAGILFYIVTMSTLTLFLGMAVFCKLKRGFADVL